MTVSKLSRSISVGLRSASDTGVPALSHTGRLVKSPRTPRMKGVSSPIGTDSFVGPISLANRTSARSKRLDMFRDLPDLGRSQPGSVSLSESKSKGQCLLIFNFDFQFSQ